MVPSNGKFSVSEFTMLLNWYRRTKSALCKVSSRRPSPSHSSATTLFHSAEFDSGLFDSVVPQLKKRTKWLVSSKLM